MDQITVIHITDMPQNKGSRLPTFVFAFTLLLLSGILAQDAFATTADTNTSVTTPNGTATVNATATTGESAKVFLNDKFDKDLQGWSDYGYPGYTVTLDPTTGQSAPSANISGDVFLGFCSYHGMAKAVDISTYSGGPLTMAFDWRASSSSGGAGLTTQAEVRVDNADTGTQLFTHRLVNSGVSDTGWQSYSNDISSYVAGVKKIQIDLYLYDCWDANWNENNWYDNISLFTGNTVPPGVTINLGASTATAGTNSTVTSSTSITASNNTASEIIASAQQELDDAQQSLSTATAILDTVNQTTGSALSTSLSDAQHAIGIVQFIISSPVGAVNAVADTADYALSQVITPDKQVIINHAISEENGILFAAEQDVSTMIASVNQTASTPQQTSALTDAQQKLSAARYELSTIQQEISQSP